MGCGASAPVKEDVPTGFTLAQQARRKRNSLAKHTHLLNVVDTSADIARETRDVAAARHHVWSDMQLWASDSGDNPSEFELQGCVTKLASIASEQEKADTALVKSANEYTEGLREILQQLKTFDEYVKAYETAVGHVKDAEKGLARANDKNEKAKKKENYETELKARMLSAISDAQAKLDAAKSRQDACQDTMHKEQVKLKHSKGKRIKQELTSMAQAWHDYYESSLALSKRQLLLLETLDVSKPPESDAAAAAADEGQTKTEPEPEPVPVASKKRSVSAAKTSTSSASAGAAAAAEPAPATTTTTKPAATRTSTSAANSGAAAAAAAGSSSSASGTTAGDTSEAGVIAAQAAAQAKWAEANKSSEEHPPPYESN